MDKNRCRAHADTNFFTQTGTPAGCVRYVAVSSSAMKGDEEKARAAGCDHYVTKPYSPMQLLRLIRGFLGDKA